MLEEHTCLIIIAEFASKRPPFDTGDSEPVKPELIDYDPAKVHPALYGIMHAKVFLFTFTM